MLGQLSVSAKYLITGSVNSTKPEDKKWIHVQHCFETIINNINPRTLYIKGFYGIFNCLRLVSDDLVSNFKESTCCLKAPFTVHCHLFRSQYSVHLSDHLLNHTVAFFYHIHLVFVIYLMAVLYKWYKCIPLCCKYFW